MIHALTILARILLVFWGLICIFPALMASDSGTSLTITGSYVLLSTCIFFILSGLFGKWSLSAGAVFGMIMVFLPLPSERVHLVLLRTLVPIVLLLTLLFAFGCIDESTWYRVTGGSQLSTPVSSPITITTTEYLPVPNGADRISIIETSQKEAND